MGNLRHEKLVDAYEKALFDLVMDEVAENEGEQLLKLNAALQADPDAEVPEQLKQRCCKIIQETAAKEKLHRAARRSRKVFRSIAVAVFICITLFTTVFAVSSDFRRNTLNAVIEVFDKYSVIKFENRESSDKNKLYSADREIDFNYNIGLKWVPDGFEVSEGWDNTSNDFVEYLNDEGVGFNVFIVSVFEDALYQFDTENTVMIPTTVQGYSAELYQKDDGRLTVLWIDTEKEGIMQVMAVGLSQEDILRIAEGVVWGG